MEVDGEEMKAEEEKDEVKEERYDSWGNPIPQNQSYGGKFGGGSLFSNN